MLDCKLDQLDTKNFEKLIQLLLREVFEVDTINFLRGPKGEYEATFRGKASYPSKAEPWKGEWIFQFRFYDDQHRGSDEAIQEVLTDIATELDKIVNKSRRECDNYIFITNIYVSS